MDDKLKGEMAWALLKADVRQQDSLNTLLKKLQPLRSRFTDEQVLEFARQLMAEIVREFRE